MCLHIQLKLSNQNEFSYMSIESNLHNIEKNIPKGVKLVAVSKYHPVADIKEAYNVGQKVFGESRMQELDEKKILLPDDIEWHFIGHLQTNKVKKIVPFVHTIQSVDSWKLLSEIENQSSAIKRQINCLLEIHISQEDSKYGFSYDECIRFLEEQKWAACKYARICGVMGMATNTDNLILIKNEFKKLRLFYEQLKSDYFSEYNHFSEISMGMSHDYLTAIEEGATIVRVGSAIFGNRIY